MVAQIDTFKGEDSVTTANKIAASVNALSLQEIYKLVRADKIAERFVASKLRILMAVDGSGGLAMIREELALIEHSKHLNQPVYNGIICMKVVECIS